MHLNRSILIDLPQPGGGVEKPVKAGVLANTSVVLKRAAAKGDGETRNGVWFSDSIS